MTSKMIDHNIDHEVKQKQSHVSPIIIIIMMQRTTKLKCAGYGIYGIFALVSPIFRLAPWLIFGILSYVPENLCLA
ncbi:MAG: hypothetical protein ACI8RD_012902 [Bacillariaceae sp.]|jgi:hypothetical protein